MRAPEQVTLVMGRVRLEPWVAAHDRALLEAAQDDQIWQWLPVPRPASMDDIARYREEHVGQPWVVVVDEVPAGSTSYLNVEVELGGLEIGWTWYRRDLWASEVNPTCKLLLLTYAFDDLGAARVSLKTDGLNARSQAAIKKLGCLYDGTLRHHRFRADGSVRDTAFFSMLAAEWPTAEARLEARAQRIT
jgi:RimJ/RimL family protein N-acetyltransferase